MDIINDIYSKLDITEEIIDVSADEDLTVYALFTKPLKMDKLPDLENFPFLNNKYIIKETSESIIKYFNSMINKELRIRSFNGVVYEDFQFYFCNYCKKKIDNITDYYYCFHCLQDMCKSCYNKSNDEINTCKEYGYIKNRCLNFMECNKCSESINNIDYYTRIYKNDRYDICIDCYDNNVDNSKKDVLVRKMKFVNKNIPFTESGFNSILYWIPIISDENYNHILINLNPDDENYKKIAFQSYDNHGRIGFSFFTDPKYTLEYVLDMLKDIINKLDSKLDTNTDISSDNDTDTGSDNDTDISSDNDTDTGSDKDTDTGSDNDTSYNSTYPIEILIEKLNLRIYFG